MIAAAPEGHRAKKEPLTQELVPRQSVAGGRMSSPSSRASDGSRPADDTDRRYRGSN